MKTKYLMRLVASVICLSMIFGLIPATAAWDGFNKTPDGGNLVKLVSFDNVSYTLSAGGSPSEITTGNDRYSLRWKNTQKTTTLKFSDVPRDWSDFTDIRFSVYSNDPTQTTKFALLINTDVTDKAGVTNSRYFTRSVATTNHVGWKEFVFTKEDDIASDNATGWDKITSITFSANWSGGAKSETADFCISSIYGSTEPTIPLVKTEPTKEGRAAALEALGNNTAIMNFSNNIIKDGKICRVDVEDRITTDNSGQIAKFGLFSNALGATVNDENGKVTITLDGQTADVTNNVVTYDDGKYLKVVPTLEALGKTVSVYDMVIIIGDKENANKIFDDSLLLEDLKFLLNENVLTADDITKEDWNELKRQWREYLIGPPGNLDDPAKQKKIQAAEKEYLSNYNSINKDPSIFALFGKSKITTWDGVLSTVRKVRNMAVAYAMEGTKYYKDPDARRTIMECLEWIHENVYGLDELINKGWRTTTDAGWTFYVGIPMEFTEAILLLGDDISMEDTKKYLYIYEQAKYATAFGASGRLYAGTLCSVLLEDYEEVLARNEDFVTFMRSNNYKADDAIRKGANSAIKEDWLYITHKYYAYSASYGSNVLLERLATVESILMGTQFEFVNPFKYDPVMWMKETFGPIVFNGAISASQSGRFKTDNQFSETGYMYYVIAAAVDLIGSFGKDDDEWLKAFVKRNVVDENRETLNSKLNTYQLEKLNEIMADESIKIEPYYNSKVYYTGDSVAHQKGDFGFAISMSSSRIGAWESIDGDNLSGWYQGDGMLYTYLKNDVLQYDLDYWEKSNPYHLPGTTVDTQERIPASIKGGAITRTNQHFVGGVQFDKDYSVAAMQLEGHKVNNPGAVVSDKNGDAPHHYSSLLAKKAWFLFDDEAVAIGTDINANDGFEVETIVENRKLSIIEDIVKPVVEEPEPQKIDGITEYKIVGVDDKGASESANPAKNSFDGDMATRLSAKGEVTITWEIEKVSPIGFVGIAQYGGTDGKQAIFDLEVSADGKSWKQVFSGKASGKTENMEAYAAGGVQAKYIRYIGYGRTNSQWNSITEVKFFGTTADGKLPADALTKVSETTKVDPDEDKILGAEQIIVDGKKIEKVSTYETIKTFTNPKWAHIENVGGYYFPQGGDLKMNKVVNSRLSFLEMWFNHGKDPQTGTYAYVVLPTKTPEETENYTKNPDIEILSNEKNLQVVREKTLGMTGLVFWEAGKFDNIETSVPMIMMTKDKDANGIYRINLSDPTKRLTEGKVTLKGNYELVEGDKRFTVISKDGETIISIDFKDAEGRSLPITLLAK